MSTTELHKLTPRQKENLRLLIRGFDAKSIAKELAISVHTVTEHLREARRRLGVSNSREAARLLEAADARPPNNMGPNTMGVGEPTVTSSFELQTTTKRRLVYIGAVIMIVFAAVALTLAFLNDETGPQAGGRGSDLTLASAQKGDPNHFPIVTIPVDDFTKVAVSGAFKVFVSVGERASEVSLVGPRAMTADVIAVVEDGILTIRFREGAQRSWNPGAGVNVVIRTPNLSSVNVEGPTTMKISGLGPKGDSFAATTQAAGSIDIRRIDVGKVSLATNGSGGISVAGSAGEAIYSTRGSGSIDAKRLRVTRAKMTVAGAGSIYADVSGETEISLGQSGSGRGEVVGGGTCVSQPVNSDRVECR